MKYKFYVKEIPDPFSVWSWIKQNTDVEVLANTVIPTCGNPSNLMTFDHNLDIEKVASITLEALDKFGYRGWRTSDGHADASGGLSLSFNPDYLEACDDNQQTLGTSQNNPTEFFYNQTKNFKSLRNTYYDTYAFRKYPPCVTDTGLTDFLKSFKRSSVRSRIGVINSKHVPADTRKFFGWHRDETVFENLRINIPVKTDNTFMFQILNKPSEHLYYGNVYSWDTNIAHRVYPTTEEDSTRVHLVLGFSPWFDYIEEDDCWVSNEFYGKMHPHDMLANGYIHEKIKGIKK
jgi:hypothetical protein